jgi:hypothetical protein
MLACAHVDTRKNTMAIERNALETNKPTSMAAIEKKIRDDLEIRSM